MTHYKKPKYKIGNIVNIAHIRGVKEYWYQHNLTPKDEDFTKENYIITKVNYIPPLNTNLQVRYELKHHTTKEKISREENFIKISIIHQRSQKLKIITKKSND
jgi:hypothetical protein